MTPLPIFRIGRVLFVVVRTPGQVGGAYTIRQSRDLLRRAGDDIDHIDHGSRIGCLERVRSAASDGARRSGVFRCVFR
jgi:hypothetical protein